VDAGAKGCSATAQAIFQNIIFKPLFLQILVLLMACKTERNQALLTEINLLYFFV